MRKLIKKLWMFFEDRRVWREKMSEPLHIRIISNP